MAFGGMYNEKILQRISNLELRAGRYGKLKKKTSFFFMSYDLFLF